MTKKTKQRIEAMEQRLEEDAVLIRNNNELIAVLIQFAFKEVK